MKLAITIFLFVIAISCSSKKQNIREVQNQIQDVTSKSDSINKNLDEISEELDRISEDTTDYKFR